MNDFNICKPLGMGGIFNAAQELLLNIYAVYPAAAANHSPGRKRIGARTGTKISNKKAGLESELAQIFFWIRKRHILMAIITVQLKIVAVLSTLAASSSL